jgi:membrane-bound serine protease (ClpP class)
MLRSLRILLFLGLLIASSIAFEARAATSTIDVLHVSGTINPVLVDYIKRGIDHAEANNAICCVIQLDTPGGLDTSMRNIVQLMVNSRVPIVVYVSPSGARAASAGVFITIAAHVAAMAPNTAIGAAHPISIGNTGEVQMSNDTAEEKVLNDAAAYIRSIATARGRNADWAEKAVRESVSATEQEALNLDVIDIVAPDLDTLISQLDGWQVNMSGGNVVTLHTKDVTINRITMTGVEDFLYTISDPNIAYLLLSLGSLGIMAELFSPGLIFPGIIGGISLLLGFYSMGVLPVNYTGLLLIVLAFGLFISELFTHSYGLLTVGGITSLVLGSLILFKGGPLFKIDPRLIATITIIIAAFFVFAVSRIIQARRRQPSTGWEELIGKTAIVRAALDTEGMVFFKGERWTAISETGRVEPDEEVIITKVDGLRLYVTKKQ